MPRARTRIYFACGLAELISCAWLDRHHLRQTKRKVLVIYGRPVSMPPAHVTETMQLAPLFGEWSHILDFTANPIEALLAHKALFDEADELVLHTLWKDDERTFVAACPNAAITLYDNGLDSHTDVPIRTNSLAVSGRFALESDLARVESAFYSLGDWLPIPRHVAKANVIVPKADTLRDLLIDLSKRGIISQLETILAPARSANIIIAGTAFFRTGRVTADAERDIYERYIAQNEGRVLYKQHPRAPQELFGNPRHAPFQIFSSIPLEFVPLVQPIERCASISSSAILTMKKTFGIGFDLLGNEMHGALDLPWLKHLCDHAQSIQ